MHFSRSRLLNTFRFFFLRWLVERLTGTMKPR